MLSLHEDHLLKSRIAPSIHLSLASLKNAQSTHSWSFQKDVALKPSMNIMSKVRDEDNRLFQRRIENPVRHLWWGIFPKTVNNEELLTYFENKTISQMFDRVLDAPLCSTNVLKVEVALISLFCNFTHIHALIYSQWAHNV